MKFQKVQPQMKCQELRNETKEKVSNSQPLAMPSNERCEVFYDNGVKG